MDRVRIGLVGFGTVGESFYRLLSRNAEEFARRLGVTVEVPLVGVRDAARPRAVAAGTRVVSGLASAAPTKNELHHPNAVERAPRAPSGLARSHH